MTTLPTSTCTALVLRRLLVAAARAEAEAADHGEELAAGRRAVAPTH